MSAVHYVGGLTWANARGERTIVGRGGAACGMSRAFTNGATDSPDVVTCKACRRNMAKAGVVADSPDPNTGPVAVRPCACGRSVSFTCPCGQPRLVGSPLPPFAEVTLFAMARVVREARAYAHRPLFDASISDVVNAIRDLDALPVPAALAGVVAATKEGGST